MQTYLTLLRQRPGFRWLFLAQLVSLGGDWFNAIATVMLVNHYTGSGLAVSFLFLARYVPPFFAGPVAGVLADRFNRKAILIVSDLLRAVIVLGFLLVNSPERVWLAYVLSVAQFIVSSFFEPARSAIVPELVAAEEIVPANTLGGVTYSTMFVIGSALGGAVAALFGAPVALIIDSASYIISAGLTGRIPSLKAPAEGHAPAAGWRDLVDGLKFTRRQPGIGAVTLVKGLGQLGSVDVMAAVLAARVFTVGQDGGGSLGLLLAAMGLGTILGPLAGTRLHRGTVVTIQRAITLGYLAIAASWLLVGLSPWFALTPAAFALRGLGGGINWMFSDVLIQMQVPNHFLGRVFSLNLAFFTLVVSVSTLATGYLLDRAGLTPAQYALGIGFVSLAPMLAWLVQTRRESRNVLASQEESAT